MKVVGYPLQQMWAQELERLQREELVELYPRGGYEGWFGLHRRERLRAKRARRKKR